MNQTILTFASPTRRGLRNYNINAFWEVLDLLCGSVKRSCADGFAAFIGLFVREVQTSRNVKCSLLDSLTRRPHIH